MHGVLHLSHVHRTPWRTQMHPSAYFSLYAYTHTEAPQNVICLQAQLCLSNSLLDSLCPRYQHIVGPQLILATWINTGIESPEKRSRCQCISDQ